MSHRPAGESFLMDPAGEMWSVVMESPTFTSTRAPSTSPGSPGSGPRSRKNGGSWTYVDSGSHSNIAPDGASSFRQWSSPSKMRPYSSSNCSDDMASAVTAATSSED